MSKRKNLSIAEKVELLRNVDSGMRKKDVAVKFGIPPSTVSTIIKKRDGVMETPFGGVDPGRKRWKTCKFGKIDEAVSQWFQMTRERNLQVSGIDIKEKALDFANLFGQSDFQASSGWLEKFKKRHGIKERKAESVLQNILNEYTPENVFKVDETGLFYKCLPSRTLRSEGDCKYDEERVTILASSNMSASEKLRLLVIGESNEPRCFRGMKSLEVDYRGSGKSLMTSGIFEEWLLNLDEKMIRQERKIALLVDKCPAHPDVSSKLSNVHLVLLLPDASPRSQPVVMKNLKLHYRKRVLQRLVCALPAVADIDLRICVAELAKAWECDVSPLTIRDSLAKAGFIDSPGDIEEENVLPQMEQCWGRLLENNSVADGNTLEEFMTIDDDVVVFSDYPTDDDVVNSIKTEQTDTEEEGGDVPCKPTEKELRAAFDTVRRGLQFSENVPDYAFAGLNACEHFFQCMSPKEAI